MDVNTKAVWTNEARVCRGMLPHSGARTLRLLLLLAGLGWSGLAVRAADTNALLSAWLQAQTNVHTWTAEFTQTRSLKALAQPLTTQGRVTFSAPNQFRWELGNPAQTIAVRQANQMLVLYPKLKRVEKFPLDAANAGPWKDALALLEAGFPRSRADLEGAFRVVSVTETGGVARLVLQPKSAQARKFMPEISIEFSITDHDMRATEMKFADGSTMRNDFRGSVLNPKIEPTVFAPEIPADFKTVEPLKGK
jgi:outer membrane lipoprotein-sorting protein